jgi:hypothetical protein
MKKLKKRKQKFQKRRKTSVSANDLSKSIKQSPVLTSPLDVLAKKREGGAESIKGFVFQCRYAAWKILKHLAPSEASEENFIRLEGIEDIDLFKVTMDGDSNEFIQVKSSKNQMDAGKFWGEHHILQNFAEVYLIAPQNRFRLVHDMPLSEGYLSRLAKSCANREVPSGKDLEHWKNKFAEFQNRQEQDGKKEVWDWSSFDLSEFFKRITFEKTSDSDLSGKICRMILANYDIAEGNEEQYVRSLCWYVLLWSKDKAVIRWEDVVKLIEKVREDIAKGPANPAVQNRWLSCVSFEASEEESHYFEGKPARPHDIAASLPARRNKWERKILDTFKEADVTVIRASSGQGKSTLAWQTALYLAEQGWRPYEMHWCADAREIGNILTFIESRIKIGELPLIVIDGLGQAVSEWGELANRTLDFPVKYIVTVREEDWYRFGADRSRLRLIPVSIEMSREEAGDIHDQFKKAGKLGSTGLKWQTAWEQVQKRGLLIEYVYLLTHGTMMEERLSHQIRVIADEMNAAEKLEILRLVSVADLCGVRLPSLSLIELVNERIGFQSDRGETLKSLEREYQILIENLDYAEGLHPVRSRHLADILHETLPMVDTLINILAVIEPDSLHEFCAHAPLLIDGKQRILFFDKLAEYVAGRTYADMVMVIDGLFSTDAKQNWEVNRKIYNDLSSRGAVNELVILDAFPWGGVNTFKDLAKNDTFKKSFEALQGDIDRMISFDPETSGTFTFIKSLSSHLTLRKSISDFQAFGRLAQWYSRFDLKFTLIDAVEESALWRALNTLDLEDAGELFDAYYSAHPEEYKAFLERNKTEIVGLLKRRTNSLTIIENEGNLQIEYLMDDNNENLNLNDESVKRAQVISSFLPQYNEYHVNAIYPPIPGLDYYTNVINESEKRMAKENIGNKFRVHVNRIWIESIMANYESASVYEWQKQWYDIRIKSLDLVSVCTRFIEAVLGGKSSKVSRIARELDRIRPEVMRLLSTVKAFPKRGYAFFNATGLEELFGAFSKWTFPWRNFLQQLLWLLNGDDREKNLVNVNVQDARRKLGKMQNAYKTIMENSFPYFSVEELTETETTEYTQLARTVAFFLSSLNHIGKIWNVKFAVANWWDKQERSRINEVKSVLSKFEDISDFEFIPPTRTIENDGLMETIIGVKGLKFKQLLEQDLLAIIVGLSGLADVDITFYHFVAIEGNYTENNNALRISRDFFEKVKTSMESDQDSFDFGISKPYPVAIQKELLDVLQGIAMKKEVDENVIKTSMINILMQLWKLSEMRERLSKEEKTENSWRRELEQGCEHVLSDQMKIIEKEAVEDISIKYQKLIEDVTKNNKPFTSEDFQRYILEFS